MKQPDVNVNGIAKLANVGLCLSALDKARTREAHLPGLVTFSGPSGWGKSTAAASVATLRDAYYVEAKSYWTKKAFLETLVKEMGLYSKDKPRPCATCTAGWTWRTTCWPTWWSSPRAACAASA